MRVFIGGSENNYFMADQKTANWYMDGGGGDDTLIGASLPDTLLGSDGNDSLKGLGGNDSISGGAGDDQIYGGTGDDTLVGGEGNDSVFGEDNNDVLHGTRGSDFLSGGVGDDSMVGGMFGVATLSGGDGNDELWAERGSQDFSADVLDGGAGDDTIYGGRGTVDGGLGNDSISVNSLDLLSGASINGGAGNDDLAISSRVTNSIVSGGDGDDVINYAGGNNLIFGGAGNDRIATTTIGSTDTIDGGSGADTVDGIRGFQVMTYAKSGEGVSIAIGSGAGVGGDALGDVLTGVEVLIGSAFDDKLTGYAYSDTIEGGRGNDILFGGIDSGNKDPIYADVFVFRNNSGVDFIQDFTNDIIQISFDVNGSGITSAEKALSQVEYAINFDGQSSAYLNLGAGNVVILVGVMKGDLTAANFHIF